MEYNEPSKKPRGFAAMTPSERSRVASLGGKEAHRLGVAHRWLAGSEEAKRAGRKGGKASKRRPKSTFFNENNS